MDIAIGVEFTAREIRLETDESADDVRKRIEEAFANDERVLWLTDDKGRQVGVPLAKLAYVELDQAGESKRVGFGPTS